MNKRYIIILLVSSLMLILASIFGCTANTTLASPPSVTTQNGWTPFTDGNHIYSLLIKKNELWAATAGGVVKWNMQMGTYQKFTAFDGLPGNDIQAIFHDKTGNLWCGGDDGIAVYEKNTWVVQQQAPVRYPIDAITADKKGNLWFHSFDQSLIHYNGKSWAAMPPHMNKVVLLGSGGPFEEDTGIPSHLIFDKNGNLWRVETYDLTFFDGQNWHDCMAGGFWSPEVKTEVPFTAINAAVEAGDGSLWFGSSDGLVRYNGEYFSNLIVPPDLFKTDEDNTPQGITAMVLDHKGNLLCANGNTLLRFDGKSFIKLGVNHLSGNPITSMAIDDNNNVWCGTSHGIFRFDGKNWQSYLTDDVFQYTMNPEVNQHELAEDRNGDIWVGTDNGLGEYDGKTWHLYTAADGLADNKITCVYADNKGRIWAGTGNSGISMFDGTAWHTFTTTDGLSSNNITAIIQDKNGNLWFGCGDGSISRYDGASWHTFENEYPGSSNPNASINDIFLDSRGTLWFTVWGNGLLSYDGTQWKNFDLLNGLSVSGYAKLIEDSNGNIWAVYADSDIARYDGVRWQNITFPESNTMIYAMAADRSGNVWFADGKDVYYYDGKTWHNASPANNPQRFSPAIITAGLDGNIWTGWIGLARYDGKSWQYYNDVSGLASNYVTGILVARNGDIWVSGQNGVSRYRAK